jgi:hypothetical protein
VGLPSIQKLAAYISKPLYIRKPSGTIAVPKEKKTSVYDVNLRLAIATGATGQAGMVMDFVNGMPMGISLGGGVTLLSLVSCPTLVTLENGRVDFTVQFTAATLPTGTITLYAGAPVTTTDSLPLVDGRLVDAVALTLTVA